MIVLQSLQSARLSLQTSQARKKVALLTINCKSVPFIVQSSGLQDAMVVMVVMVV